jgi:parallel beta-helix repeat protein
MALESATPRSRHLRKISAAAIKGQVSLFGGNSAGTARENTCENNGLNGIAVAESAQPTLEKNMCRSNQWSGIAFLGNSAGIARENTCENNGMDGIAGSPLSL